MDLARALTLVDGEVVSRQRLRGLGVAPSTIGQAVRDGRLSRLARGIYACAPSPDLLRMGSELGVLSHRSAAQVHGIAVLGQGRTVDVTVMHRRRRAPTWAVLHRARLEPPDVDVVDGLGVTSVERTVRDLAGSLALHEAVVAMDSAARQGFVEVGRLAAMAAAARGPGSARLRAAVGHSDHRSDSPLETLLRLTLTGAGFYPDTQVQIEGVGRVDFLFPAQRLVVEADGFAFHADRTAYREDRRRGNALQARGYHLLRFTWEDVVHAPDAVVRTVRDVLARADP